MKALGLGLLWLKNASSSVPFSESFKWSNAATTFLVSYYLISLKLTDFSRFWSKKPFIWWALDIEDFIFAPGCIISGLVGLVSKLIFLIDRYRTSLDLLELSPLDFDED